MRFGHLMWCGLPSVERARKISERFLNEDLFSGWGLRTLSSNHVAYNPLASPHLPEWLPELRVSNIPIGHSRLSVNLKFKNGFTTVEHLESGDLEVVMNSDGGTDEDSDEGSDEAPLWGRPMKM